MSDGNPVETICYLRVVRKLPGNVTRREHHLLRLQYLRLAPMSGAIRSSMRNLRLRPSRRSLLRLRLRYQHQLLPQRLFQRRL